MEADDDGGARRFPDYAGNRMFQTLGNLAVDPRAGLLFLDWRTGDALQVSGRATIVWDEDEVARRPGAERLVDVGIEAVVQRERAMPARWELIEPSRLNPPVRRWSRAPGWPSPGQGARTIARRASVRARTS